MGRDRVLRQGESLEGSGSREPGGRETTRAECMPGLQDGEAWGHWREGGS